LPLIDDSIGFIAYLVTFKLLINLVTLVIQSAIVLIVDSASVI